MTPNEFKAWFDGFTEAFEGRIPTKAQWARIRDRVAEIDGKRVTETVYVDRYVRPYPYWQYLGHGVCIPHTSSAVGIGASSGLGSFGQNASSGLHQQYAQAASCNNQATSFNSMQAMNELGRVEAKALAA